MFYPVHPVHPCKKKSEEIQKEDHSGIDAKTGMRSSGTRGLLVVRMT
jgi:hypothetical protein